MEERPAIARSKYFKHGLNQRQNLSRNADITGLISGSTKMANMASGDAQRVWFPEMVEFLRTQWRRDMSFAAIVKMPDNLDGMLQRIRFERQIRPAVVKCPKCGNVGECEEPHVSLRAMLLSIVRFNIDAAGPVQTIEKGWNAYRKHKGLDLYGKPGASKAEELNVDTDSEDSVHFGSSNGIELLPNRRPEQSRWAADATRAVLIINR